MQSVVPSNDNVWLLHALGGTLREQMTMVQEEEREASVYLFLVN